MFGVWVYCSWLVDTAGHLKTGQKWWITSIDWSQGYYRVQCYHHHRNPVSTYQLLCNEAGSLQFTGSHVTSSRQIASLKEHFCYFPAFIYFNVVGSVLSVQNLRFKAEIHPVKAVTHQERRKYKMTWHEIASFSEVNFCDFVNIYIGSTPKKIYD